MTRRFDCTLGGAIGRGRGSLAKILLGLCLGMVALAVFVWLGDRRLPALLCLAVAFVIWTAWRMSGDLDLFWLDLSPGERPQELHVQMRRQRLRLPLFAPSARRLTAEERSHVELLASQGVLVAGTGGFDSHRLGEFNLYASDLVNAVLVDTGESQLVVTPDDPEAFIAALEGPRDSSDRE